MIDSLRVFLVDHILGMVQEGDIPFQNLGYIFFVFQADVLPHGRRGRSDTGNIFETARGKVLHQFFLCIRIPHVIHQAGCDDMRQMAYGSGHIIMFLVVQKNRDSMQKFDEFCIACYLFLRDFTRWRQYKICIFNQHCLRVDIAAFFRTRHRMSADKVFFNSEILYFSVDTRLHAAYVSQNAVFVKVVFYLLKISGVIGYRGAQEDIAAVAEVIVNGCCRHVDNGFLGCQGKSLFVLIKGRDLIVGKVLPDRPCDRTSDET